MSLFSLFVESVETCLSSLCPRSILVSHGLGEEDPFLPLWRHQKWGMFPRLQRALPGRPSSWGCYQSQLKAGGVWGNRPQHLVNGQTEQSFPWDSESNSPSQHEIHIRSGLPLIFKNSQTCLRTLAFPWSELKLLGVRLSASWWDQLQRKKQLKGENRDTVPTHSSLHTFSFHNPGV